MYRILKNSIINFCNDFENFPNDIRFKDFSFIRLLTDPMLYNIEKLNESDLYKNLSSFLHQLQNLSRCQWICHELHTLGFEAKKYNDDNYTEQIKTFYLFLDMAYWRD